MGNNKCPKCNCDSLTINIDPITRNTIYTCAKCGYKKITHISDAIVWHSDNDYSIKVEPFPEIFVIDCRELQFNINGVELKTDSNFFEHFDSLVINGIEYKKVK